MRLRRRVRRSLPAVVSLALLSPVSGCSHAVQVDRVSLSPAQARVCHALVRALPESVSDQTRRPVQPAVADDAAAWGDPPIVLRCGVHKPSELDRFATCQVANGVGWFIPDEEIQGRPSDVVMTTVARAVYVQVRLPEQYWPPAAAMVDLAPAIKRTVPERRPCL